MNSGKILGALLVLASLAIGYIGINKITDSTKEINLLGLKIDASDESGQQEGYIYLFVALVVFAGGVYASKSKNK